MRNPHLRPASPIRVPWPHRLTRWSLWSVAMILTGILVLLASTLEHNARVDVNRELSAEETARARAVLRDSLSLRQTGDGDTRLELSEVEINATANYLFGQVGKRQIRVRLDASGLEFKASHRLPGFPFALYVNIHARAGQAGDRLSLDRILLGDLPIPVPLIEGLLRHTGLFWPPALLYELAGRALHRVDVQPDRLSLTLRWDARTQQEMREVMAKLASPQQLQRYQSALSVVLRDGTLPKRPDLGQLMQPLAAVALQRARDRDPAEENRAWLMTLANYLGGQHGTGILTFGPGALPRRTVLLRHRMDLAKHFVFSAALASAGEDALADVAGLVKEVNDAHGGSGFNFQDLAADVAGARFGELAVATPQSALRLMERLQEPGLDTHILPDIHDLPENLGTEAFQQRFGQIGSPEFRALAEVIARRVEDLPLYRELNKLADPN